MFKNKLFKIKISKTYVITYEISFLEQDFSGMCSLSSSSENRGAATTPAGLG